MRILGTTCCSVRRIACRKGEAEMSDGATSGDRTPDLRFTNPDAYSSGRDGLSADEAAKLRGAYERALFRLEAAESAPPLATDAEALALVLHEIAALRGDAR